MRMAEDQKLPNWENDHAVISAMGLAYSIAALTMQIFTMTNTRPQSDEDLRAMLRRMAPPGTPSMFIAAAEDAVRSALLEVDTLQSRTATLN